MTTALVFASRHEVGPLLRHKRDNLLFWPTGPGIAAAHAAAEALIESHHPEAIVSIGTCSGLVPDLGPGDLVIPTEVRSESGDSFRPSLPPLGIRAAGGPLLTLWEPAATPKSKREKRATGAIACDMETAAVVTIAEKAGVPWISIRVVFDPVDASLPFNEVKTLEPASLFLRHPKALFYLPRLIRWHLACQRTFSKLAPVLIEKI